MSEKDWHPLFDSFMEFGIALQGSPGENGDGNVQTSTDSFGKIKAVFPQGSGKSFLLHRTIQVLSAIVQWQLRIANLIQMAAMRPKCS